MKHVAIEILKWGIMALILLPLAVQLVTGESGSATCYNSSSLSADC